MNLAQSMTFTTAFKEWACIVDSLGGGQQIFIIRKGGIHEKDGRFEPEHRRFLLFPTYEHQKQEDLNFQGRKYLDAFDSAKEPDPVPIRYGAVIQQVYWIEDRKLLPALESFQALNQDALEKRFTYGDRTGFFGIVLRVFHFQAVFLPRLPHYAGCRSWISLNPGVTLTPAAPVMQDAVFNEQAQAIDEALKRNS